MVEDDLQSAASGCGVVGVRSIKLLPVNSGAGLKIEKKSLKTSSRVQQYFIGEGGVFCPNWSRSAGRFLQPFGG